MSQEFSALDLLAESFLARLRRGESVSPEDYAARAPELAGQIRELFPMLAAMETISPALASAQGEARRIGDFRLVREVGRGGMGIVYEAVQEPLGRHVALKVLARSDGLMRERFQREARIAARLHHTNIVPVFGVGTEGDVFYFAMQFIDGRPLSAVLEESRRHRSEGSTVSTAVASPSNLPFREVAQLMLQATEALAYAHNEGVLHRDLKPSNLLLDGRGTLWVADFGLATAEGEENLTRTGDLVGTLRYLAPERFSGNCDARSDIYALGATLYELLTLQPAFPEGDHARLVERITNDEPTPPRDLAPGVPRDLETIALKAMQRDPKARYATAAELAEDLRRYLSDRPITARRQTFREQMRRLSRRYPGRTAAIITSFAALLLGSVAAIASAVVMRGERDAARAAEQKADEARREANLELHRARLNESRAARGSGLVGQRLLGLQAIQSVRAALATEDISSKQISELRDEAVACLALPDLKAVRRTPTSLLRHPQETSTNAALDLFACETPDHSATLLTRPGDPDFVQRLGELPPTQYVVRLLSADGAWLAEGLIPPAGASSPSLLRVWNCIKGEKVLECAVPLVYRAFAFCPGGRHLVLASTDGTLRQYDIRAGREVSRSSATYRPWTVAVSPDGRRVAVGSNFGPIDIVEIAGWATRDRISGDSWVNELAWSPDSRWLAIGRRDGRVGVWGAERREVRLLAESHRFDSANVAFSADGSLLASSGSDGMTRLWDWPSGRPLVRVPGRCLGFETNGPHLLVQDHNELCHYRIEGRRELRVLAIPALSAVFSPDGRLLATSGHQGVRLWCASTLGSRADLSLDPCDVASFNPRDGSLATVGLFSQLRLWPRSRRESGWQLGPPRVVAMPWPQHLGRQAAWSRDGEKLAVVDHRAGRVSLLANAESKDLVPLGNLRGLVRLVFSPDGKWVVGIARERLGSTVFRLADGAPVHELPRNDCVAFSPDGQTLIAGSLGTYQILRTGTWSVLNVLTIDERDADWCVAAFSPDGRLLVLSANSRSVRLYNATTAELLVALTFPETTIVDHLDFSPDGTRLAVTRRAEDVLIWDLRALREQLALLDLDWSGPSYGPDPIPEPAETIEVVTGHPSISPLEWSNKWRFMARMESLRNNVPDAIHALTAALKSLPHDAPIARAEILTWRGREYQRNDSHEAAREDWSEATALAPEARDAGYLLARLLVEGPPSVRDPRRALPLALTAADRKPVLDGATGLLGAVYTRLGRFEEAGVLLERSLQTSVGTLRSTDLFFLALARAGKGDPKGADSAFHEACLELSRGREKTPEQKALLMLKEEFEGRPRQK